MILNEVLDLEVTVVCVRPQIDVCMLVCMMLIHSQLHWLFCSLSITALTNCSSEQRILDKYVITRVTADNIFPAIVLTATAMQDRRAF